MAIKTYTESARERETYKYAAAQLVGALYQNHSACIDPSELHTAPDSILTSLAELLALRVHAERAIISLFDQRWQYIIAEATPCLTLAPNAASSEDAQLLLCGTAVPRKVALCEHVISRNFQDSRVQGDGAKPISVITDISSKLADNPFFKKWPHSFYAGIPIQSPQGIDIGVLSIYGNEPRNELDDTSVALIQDVSRAIMGYFTTIRSRDGHRRADRMVRGLGTFVEGQASLSGWQTGTNIESFTDGAQHPEGMLNVRQQGLQRRRTISDVRLSVPTNTNAASAAEALGEGSTQHNVSSLEENSDDTAAKYTFSKAANILRESIEVEGALFLDASISSFGGGINRSGYGRGHGNRPSSTSSSSDDFLQEASVFQDTDVPCRVLGFSNSSQSSIDGDFASQDHSNVSEKLLRRLIKRYPNGNIFNFHEDGSLSSRDSSDEDSPSAKVSSIKVAGISPDRSERKKNRSAPVKDISKMIIELFPKARSVAFVPTWDSHKQRWFAGGFIYTRTVSRIFTMEGELSYFTAFASIVMAEVHHHKAYRINKTKTDLLGSISHELRSPLHGVVLGAELLQDTELDIFQQDILNSIENCCRTLMGTIDHLLDWTKINKFREESSRERRTAQSGRRRDSLDCFGASIETGMISRTSQVDIASIAEQVVESMFAGHSFQTISVMRTEEGKHSANTNQDMMRALDSMQAIETGGSHTGKSGNVRNATGELMVALSVRADMSWMFVSQPGAIRRILMNLLGNALKFSTQGYVELRLGQETLPGKRTDTHLVTFTVTDTGRGIGQEFLKHQLFRPFAQEDSLVSGAGLGLSLVRKIVSSLRGSIHATSKVGEGSVFTVKLPLMSMEPPLLGTTISDDAQDEFQAQVTELQGLRVSITSYPSGSDQTVKGVIKTALMKEHTMLVDTCTNWLHMRVIEPHEMAELLPDLVLCGDRFLNKAFDRSRGSSSTPTVVICRNALLARQLATSTRFSAKSGAGIMEFVSQPLGPRKLAKVLLQSFRRWTKLQEYEMSTQVLPDYLQTDPGDILPAEKPEMNPVDQITRQFADHTFSPSTPPTVDLVQAGGNEFYIEDEPQLEHGQTPTPQRQEAVKTPVGGSPDQNNHVAQYLLVDDNAINLRILTAYMRKLGHAYDTSSDGLEALQTFQKGNGQYKCVFMDISMPVMDGFESSRCIRTFERENKLSRCRIYALTGLASADAQQEAFASGIDLFLAKPVKLKELSQILETNPGEMV